MGQSYIDYIITNKPGAFQTCSLSHWPIKATNHLGLKAVIGVEGHRSRSQRKPIGWTYQHLATYLSDVQSLMKYDMTLSDFGEALQTAAKAQVQDKLTRRQRNDEEQLIIRTLKTLWRQEACYEKRRILGRFISAELGHLSKRAANRKAQKILECPSQGGGGKGAYRK